MLPQRCCDLVLKGGIASGVVYPSAIREIAEKFSLVGLAGTSAGAIAASLAAAAELRRRRTGSFEGFERLESLADEIAGPGRLLALFGPDAETAARFHKVARWMGGGLDLRTKASLGWTLRSKKSRERFLGPIVENGFGLATGMANGLGDPELPALTRWLSDLLDEIAGQDEGVPLTFADLRDAPMAPGQAPFRSPGDPSIDFRAVTTCLSLGRPFELPFSQRIFAFDPAEMERLFPSRVVAHLVERASAIDSALLGRDGKLPLPVDDLPVIVAVRMSLSFPLLFTMVPLWTVHHDREGDPLLRTWFSDGGVTSNFPMHRFDHLVPRWPTLAINLEYTGPSGVPERRRLRREESLVHLARRRSDGARELWKEVGARDAALADLFSFLGSLFHSAQTWHDNSFLRLPGFRDRLAEIWLRPEEGGMNLDMPEATIRRLVERGRDAGRALAERFAAETPAGERPDPMSWEGHRWTLARSNLAGLAEELKTLARHVDAEGGSEGGLAEAFESDEVAPAYRFDTAGDREEAAEILRTLVELGRRLEENDPFEEGPRPSVEIGTRAPF